MKINVKHIDQEFTDERGFISRIINGEKYKIHSVLYIKRKKGSRGADHYHKTDTHFVYVAEGKVKRSEKDVKNKSKVTSVILKPGDLVFTPAMVAHSDEFLEDSVIIAITTKKRNQIDYENDTVRVNLFKNEK